MSPKLILIEGSDSLSEFEIINQEYLLGRVAPADILIPGSGVSGRHARVFQRGNDLLIEDLGSTNGTFVNGNRIAGPAILNDGDEIGLGQTVRLRVASPGAQPVEPGQATELEPLGGTMLESEPKPVPPPVRIPTPPPPAPEDPRATVVGDMDASGAPPQLQVSIAGGASRTHELNRVQVTIGREPGNDIVIDSRIVSRQHARLERMGDGGYRLVVLSTSNP
ncbi:MAG TPA: FHA domain-containing protein, partial [Anaerolineales bacterium]|nr:FHA domain-containing protein [Anaerolineales bacterium]